MAGDLEALARRHRRAILDVDRQLATDLIAAYASAWIRLRTSLDALTLQIEAARQAGETPDAGGLLRQERFRSLEQQEAVRLAEQHAREAVTAAMGEPPAGVGLNFNLLPADAVRALVSSLSPGEPLTALLDSLGPEAAKAVKVALTDGLILGEGPAQIARRARTAFGGNAVRSIRLVRTEIMRSYREANRLSYKNSGVASGWRWMAALSTRSCGFCWARHGSLHDLDEPMATHPACRCTMTVELLPAFAGDQDAPRTGPEAFADLDDDQQRAVLGGAKFAALQAGAISLTDLAATKRTRDWGRVGYEPSLTSIVGAERARAIIAGVRTA